jgi:glycerol-3-phosphate acyltransferase PlsY
MITGGAMIFVYLLAAYIIGSIPTAIIAGRLLRKIDIRDHGSGNAGATNVFRVLGWKPGLIVLLIDMLKGFIVVFYISTFVPADTLDTALIQVTGGLAAILGHIFSLFAQFKGGKGVGTAAGVFLGLEPLPVLICLVIFIAIVWITRYVSLGSICAAIFLPVFILLKSALLDTPLSRANLTIAVILMLTIIITHRSNITRLLNRQENKLTLNRAGDKT